VNSFNRPGQQWPGRFRFVESAHAFQHVSFPLSERFLTTILAIMMTIEVAIDHGRVTPVEPHTLPEHGRGLLTVIADAPSEFIIGTEADGLPVIRAKGGIITAAQVREIEGFSA
jgi:hypothetical protein